LENKSEIEKLIEYQQNTESIFAASDSISGGTLGLYGKPDGTYFIKLKEKSSKKVICSSKDRKKVCDKFNELSINSHSDVELDPVDFYSIYKEHKTKNLHLGTVYDGTLLIRLDGEIVKTTSDPKEAYETYLSLGRD